MSSSVTLKPRTFFLKNVRPQIHEGAQKFSFFNPSRKQATSTKESLELKEYAEKMLKEQKLSSQKINQLVSDKSSFNFIDTVITANDTYDILLSSTFRKTARFDSNSNDFENR